jgi:hypothetical protein
VKAEEDDETHTEKADEETDEKETLVVSPSVALPDQEGHAQVNTEGRARRRDGRHAMPGAALPAVPGAALPAVTTAANASATHVSLVTGDAANKARP